MKFSVLATALCLVLVCVLIVLLVPQARFWQAPYAWQSMQRRSITTGTPSAAASDSDGSSSTPTLYLHGYKGGAVTTNSMIADAVAHEHATKVLTATVSAQGKVSLQGEWPRDARRPLIQVLFTDSANENYMVTRGWVHELIATLQRRYHIKRYNVVAHSMGNMVLLYYLVQYGQDAGLPRLEHFVAIGGNFNGTLGEDDKPNSNALRADGSPEHEHKDYRYIFERRNAFPTGVRILNVYGNMDDGTNADGDVTVVSARSLRYLLHGRYGSYRELAVHGPAGQHSKLHENSNVDRVVGAFLWGDA